MGTMPNPEASTPVHADAAASASPPVTAPPVEKPKTLWSVIVNTVLNLALVLIVAYLVLAGVKKYYAGPRPARVDGIVIPRTLRVIETMNLGPGHKVHLVVIGQRSLLIAQTAQQLSFLQDVTEDPAIQELVAQRSAAPVGATGFTGVLTQLLARPAPASPPAPPPAQAVPLARYMQGRQTGTRENPR